MRVFEIWCRGEYLGEVWAWTFAHAVNVWLEDHPYQAALEAYEPDQA